MAYDDKQKQTLKTGLFLLLGLIVIIFSIIILSGNKNIFISDYQLKAKFSEVQGLNVGSVVSLSGINVGNVAKIDFMGDQEQIVVTLRIESRYQSKITQNATAKVKTQGALGDRYVFIKPILDNSPVLKAGEFINVESEGDFFDVISKEGPKLTHIVDVISELKILLANLNKDQNSAKLIENLVNTTLQSQSFLKEGQNLLSDFRNSEQKELQEAIARLNSILGKIDRGEGSLGALINDPAVHDQLSSFLGKPPRNSYLKPLIRATIKMND